ncbi:MAG TPA: hypothetical protein VET82_04955, partial [Candidatus Eisenbacteria bacterium]|nr:hypothetical protein [Candidatus Eisenbacteria bacterium]
MRLGAGTVVLCLVALLAMLWPQGTAASSGNAGIKLQKTVDAAAVTPILALSLSADKPQTIPSDTLTYSSTVTNTRGVLGLTGRFVAAAHADTDATVVYYWDELQACLTGCGNGLGDPHWTALVAFIAGQPNYQPITPPAVSSGLSLTATPIPASDVTYPASGDQILGTDIGAKATAAWTYQATVSLTPAQMAVLTDPKQVQHLRNVVHFEVQPRNSTAAQPFDDGPQFVNPLQAQTNAAAATNVVVTITLPSGQTVQFSSSTTPALASLAPGASVNLTTTYTVPVIAAKGTSETDATYLARLAAINGTTLRATVTATASGPSGPATVLTAPVAATIEQVPIVGITKSGPGASDAGATVTYQLALKNSGGATASPLAVNDRLSDGGSGTVSSVPSSLAAGAA